MALDKPYLDIPGTTIFDAEQSRKGYALNQFCMSLMSAENRARFKADPVRYAPQFSDYCAMALSKGELVEANPENWTIVDGKLYIFGKSMGPELFRKDVAANQVKAEGNRAKLPPR